MKALSLQESTSKVMDIEVRKLHFIQDVLSISNEKIIDKLESLLKEEQARLNPDLKEKLTSRALRANEDIQEGRVYSRKEAEAKLKARMGI